jgi:Lar family restriction alleviation protein
METCVTCGSELEILGGPDQDGGVDPECPNGCDDDLDRRQVNSMEINSRAVELKACPFCGSAAKYFDHIGSPYWTVACSKCGADQEDDDLNIAISRWNTRTTLATVEEGHYLPNWLWCERCQAWIETEHVCGKRYRILPEDAHLDVPTVEEVGNKSRHEFVDIGYMTTVCGVDDCGLPPSADCHLPSSVESGAAPERIWIHVSAGGVLWAQSKHEESDIEYIRRDLVPASPQEEKVVHYYAFGNRACGVDESNRASSHLEIVTCIPCLRQACAMTIRAELRAASLQEERK